MPSPAATEPVAPAVQEALRRYWGFSTLRPLQAQAIEAGLTHRDSLVVMPTGGGKSLCYQVPPVVAQRVDVVVSPLIALMKDQVDGLQQCGYPAAALHTNLQPAQRKQIEEGISQGRYRLIFASPERVVSPWFQNLMERVGVRAIAIDEAHCISQWGHDFRLEYRQLALLKERFPHASIHAFTATATPQVRQDIIDQLRLVDPAVLVGRFDRPNLVYRILPQLDVEAQTVEVAGRHVGEAMIVYCLSRQNTHDMAAALQAAGFRAAYYHAGMEPSERSRVQDDFALERVDIVVATVAFGMGIDRSNVRCIVHASMPKSIEHYQQETGRAGRDGLEAQCVLFYSAADVMRWEGLIAKSAEKAVDPQAVIAGQTALLRRMQLLCNSPRCRHAVLSDYFGQDYEKDNCAACDVCLGEVREVEDATLLAQKILSAVARTGQSHGVGHVVQVLLGSRGQSMERLGHDKLSTHGLLRDMSKVAITSHIFQLVDQDVLVRTSGQRPVLRLNAASLEVMRGRRTVRLLQPPLANAAAPAARDGWEEVDLGLFEHVRVLRRQIASERSVPAFVVLSDATLRQMARLRPASLAALGAISGWGQRKLADFGDRFIQSITQYCRGHGLDLDESPPYAPPGASRRSRSSGSSKTGASPAPGRCPPGPGR